MTNDFYLAFLTGWTLLLVFWSTIIFFIYIRNPPNSRLTAKVVIRSYLILFMFLLIIVFLKYTDSIFN